MLREFKDRMVFWKRADRIGPDIILSHWRFFLKTTMRKFCKKKFLHFANTAEVRPGAYVIGCSKISIGERVVIRPGTMLFGEANDLDVSIVIGDNVLIGSGVQIYVKNHCFSKKDTLIIDQGHSEGGQVIVGEGSWIGANTIILPGVIIGEHSVIGAGSVVTKSIPDKVVAFGNPARVIKRISPTN